MINIIKYRIYMRIIWLKDIIKYKSYESFKNWVYEYHGQTQYDLDKYWYYYQQFED